MSGKAIDDLQLALREFARDRDWDQFHSPKNLATALIVEAAELLEPFQWMKSGERADLSAAQREHVALEMADVFLYLIRLADKLGIDLLQEAQRKLELNAVKYPAVLVRGSSKKYTEL